jgi:hypothetical protein
VHGESDDLGLILPDLRLNDLAQLPLGVGEGGEYLFVSNSRSNAA